MKNVRTFRIDNAEDLAKAFEQIFKGEQSKVEEEESSNNGEDSETDIEDSTKKVANEFMQKLISGLAEESKEDMNKRLESLKTALKRSIDTYANEIQRNCPGCLVKKYLKGKLLAGDVMYTISNDNLGKAIQAFERLQRFYIVLFGEHYESKVENKHEH